MAGFFQSIKMMLTGQVVHQRDIDLDGTTVSLRLKRAGGQAHEYVVLVLKSAGNYQYCAFELDQFDRFIEAAKSVRAASRSPSSS